MNKPCKFNAIVPCLGSQDLFIAIDDKHKMNIVNAQFTSMIQENVSNVEDQENVSNVEETEKEDIHTITWQYLVR